MRRLRLQVRPSFENNGLRAQAYGIRVGYWPCLKAPFIGVSFYKWRVEMWFGLPSYRRVS